MEHFSVATISKVNFAVMEQISPVGSDEMMVEGDIACYQVIRFSCEDFPLPPNRVGTPPKVCSATNQFLVARDTEPHIKWATPPIHQSCLRIPSYDYRFIHSNPTAIWLCG
jgi:hypothetical protein